MSDKNETDKHYGRMTGWCNFPSTIDSKLSHSKCDGIWDEMKDYTLYCPCECHDLKSKKLANAKKFKKEKKTDIKCSAHPTYGAIRKPRKDCKACWEMYYHKNPEKKETTNG